MKNSVTEHYEGIPSSKVEIRVITNKGKLEVRTIPASYVSIARYHEEAKKWLDCENIGIKKLKLNVAKVLHLCGNGKMFGDAYAAKKTSCCNVGED